jgi:transcriptional regulator of heat shock response
VYRRLRTLKDTSVETGIDQAQLSRWKKEDEWDAKMEAISTQVRGKMGLEQLDKDTDISHYSIEDQIHLQRLQELAVMGLEAIEKGEVRFEKMSEVIRVLKDLAYERRMLEGEPTDRTETTLRLKVGGEGADSKLAIRAILEIIADVEDPVERHEVIETTLVEPDITT